ncbi:MAG TPA: myo-inosose-2 dehydratase [Steroidobacteraceae bacterium]|jgi:inosose dehydratase|nr:myo-inosose-2 dehydratase [Steroidobacteraceae bacterium]
MQVRLGANPIIWSNDDLRELGADITLETCLRQARDIGFEGMELGHKFPRDAGALRALLERFGLRCVSGWYSAELLVWGAREERTRLRAHLELLKALGCPVLVFAEVSGAVHGDLKRPLSERPILTARDWAELGRQLTEVGVATAQQGVRLAYHHHMGTAVQSEADIDALMQSTGPEVGLLLDSGHAAFAGADPAALARRYAERICHVHAKDVRTAVVTRARSGNWSFLRAVLEGVFTVPGDGSIAFEELFAPLSGYCGWVVLEAEQDPSKADPLSYATLGYRNLRGYLGGTAP